MKDLLSDSKPTHIDIQTSVPVSPEKENDVSLIDTKPGYLVDYCGSIKVGHEGDVKQIEKAIRRVLHTGNINFVPVRFECLELAIKISQDCDDKCHQSARVHARKGSSSRDIEAKQRLEGESFACFSSPWLSMAATRTNLRNSTSSTQASNNPASNHNLQQQQQQQQQPQFNVSDNQYFYEDLVYRVDKKGNVEFGIVMGNDDQDMSEDSSSNEDSPKRKKGEIRVVWHPSGVEELINSKKDNDFPRTSEFYPGQHLWGPVQCLEDALWLQCTKEMKTRRKSKMQRVTKFVVEKVETDWVGVHWQCRAYSKDGICSDQAHPKFVVEGEDLKKLKLLNIFEPSTLQVDIPSTQLYPIHHLDDKEFFPGDFVVDQKEESRMYGVVQSVDHQGRTAKIKWFTTYTSSQSPTPTFLEEREVSVYDLKDHPDFQYRPGTVVIRIANFEGEDSGCTAGQVLDNFPEGRVKVWWVDGHVSMCWPQDLYKIGEYDSDEGELWDDASSEASWETELEDSCVADSSVGDNNGGGGGGNNKLNPDNIKPKLAAHIEKARIAMSRLEEIFTQNPALQTTEVMRKLLEVYKDCRYMDKLMGTSFFHESHFQGLLERVRERGRANVAQRMAEQVNRLFTQSENASENDVDLVGVKPIDASKSGDDSFEKSGLDEVNVIFTEDESLIISEENQSDPAVAEQNSNQLFVSINRNPEDSGLYSAEMSKKESSSSDTSGEFILSEDTNNMDRSPAQSEGSKTSPLPENHLSTPHVCVKLCNLIKAQLVLAHAEVSKRFDLPKISLSDAAKTVIASNASNISITSNTGKKVKKAEDKKIEFLSEPSETSLEEISAPVYPEGEGFSIDETAPDSHKFKLTMFQPTDRANFFRTVSKELKLLKSSLPPGIWVKGFEDRMDLYSVMMRGPEKTPYEDGLFLFDFQLSVDYPSAPPLCHYISYCSDRLNPNLYEDGKVCVSLLGTWAGRGTEVWTSSSTLLQVIVSIQGLILVAEPYFNEAGFEKQKGSQQGRENSRMYNEMVVLMLVQSQTKLIQYPPPVFKDAIIQHFEKHAEKLLKRLELWMEISEQYNNQHPLSPVTPTTFKETSPFGSFALTILKKKHHCSRLSIIYSLLFPDKQILPEFPLIPASKGFCITLKNTLANFKRTLIREGIIKLPLETSMTQSATDETSLSESPKGRKSFPTDGISGTSTPERVVVCSANNQGNRNNASVVELNESTTKRDSIEHLRGLSKSPIPKAYSPLAESSFVRSFRSCFVIQ
ncbi:unnamed protein product [Trichogramma brassicae]|uniref:UBC core domain-containing protein n=1 Tax=Trichogramma brassicae TaxID=86971 RepID=A0A6H5IQ67_9HYME|nr:unnamed protein product [Trichogramma brassicae]